MVIKVIDLFESDVSFFSILIFWLFVCIFSVLGKVCYLFICLAHFPFCILINMLPTRHPSYFCRNSNFDSLKKRHTSKMKGSERNMINRWKTKKIKKRNIWGRKNIQSHHLVSVWIGVIHRFFVSLWIQNTYIQFFFFLLILLATPTTFRAFQCQQATDNKIFVVHQTSSVINVHMSLSHRVF